MGKGAVWIMKTLVASSTGVLFAATNANAAPGTWQDPAGGWEAVYQASSGLLPSQLDGTGVNKTWSNQQPRLPASVGYQTTNSSATNYAGLANDALTGEAALVLRHSDNTANPVFALNVAPGSGTPGDMLTIDVRFRLLTDLPTTPTTSNVFPLFMDIMRPPSAAQLAANSAADEQFFQVRFRENNLIVLGLNGLGAPVTFAGSTAIQRQWHDLRILWDADGGAQFFLDGSSTPQTFTGGLTTIFPRVNTTITPGTELNTIQFGDSGSGVGGVGGAANIGQASIAHVKVTSDEFAAVIPEPAAAMLLFTAAGASLARRRPRFTAHEHHVNNCHVKGPSHV